uniref:HIT-type domain-containing protein n=1 Tax=Trichuris muris TaxID=70415 RepID=A0A5S6QKJ1_TRIMR
MLSLSICFFFYINSLQRFKSDSVLMAAIVPSSLVCCVCSHADSKYKCPLCQNPFCSVDCYKIHKGDCALSIAASSHLSSLKEGSCTPASGCSTSARSAEPNSRTAVENVVSQEDLHALKTCPALLKLLKGNTNLRSLLVWLDQHPTPQLALDCAMKEPDFRRFCSLCLETLNKEQQSAAVPLCERNAESMLVALLKNEPSPGTSL